MTGNSTPTSFGMYFYIITASTEYSIALPVNLWALVLIISSKRNVIETHILTLNLLVMEILCSLYFFLWLIQHFTHGFFPEHLTNFYQGAISMGRAIFQWHVCMDRYMAVAHPITFMRYKQIRYRGACLVALWLVVLCCALNNVFFTLDPMLIAVCALALLLPTLSTGILCSLLIVRILRKSGPGDRETQEKKEGNRMKRRAIRIISFLTVMVVVNNFTFLLCPLVDLSKHNDFFPVALGMSTLGCSAHGFFFLSRAGMLRCKYTR